MSKIAVIGLGGLGGAIASRLQAAGAEVIGFDTTRIKNPPVPMAASAIEAASGADIVISAMPAASATRVAESLANAIAPDAIFADLSTGTPASKLKLAGFLPAGCFVDVAFPEPASGFGDQPTIWVSGPSARRLAEGLEPFGMQLDCVSEQPGDAAARNLIRGALSKGLAALLIDTLWAAKSAGLDAWALTEIERLFDSSSNGTVHELLDSTAKHAKKRSVEMTDIAELFTASDYESTMVNGIGLTMSHIMHGRKVPFANLDDD